MFPFNRLRMDNIYGSQQQQQREPSQYPMFEEFLRTVVPAIESSKSRGRKFEREKFGREKRAQEDMFDLQARESEKNRMFQERGNLSQIAAQSAQQQQPMGVKYQPFISPLDEAKLALQSRRADITEGLGLERIAAQREATGGRIDLGREQLGSREKIAEGRLRSTEEIAASKNALTRELATLRGNQDMAAVNRRGEIARELQQIEGEQRLAQIEAGGEQTRQTQAEKPITPPSAAGEKTNIQIRYNKFINENPELRDFVSLDPDTGMPIINEDTGGFLSRGKKLSPEGKRKIMDALYPSGSNSGNQGKKDPGGIR